jgi:hypothetical protein
MTFWSDSTASPKLSFRWTATLGSSANKIETYSLKSFQKPSFEISVAEYYNINDVAYKPGMLIWNPIEVVLIDAESSATNNSSILYNIVSDSGYVTNTLGQPQSAIVKKSASAALGGMITFNQINAKNKDIERWTLVNPFVIKVNFGQATYGADEIMTVDLSIRYDYAQYERLL